MSRDYVGDMAETVALLWPKRDGRAARNRRRDDRASPTRSSGCARPRARRAARACRDARPSRRVGPVRAAQAGASASFASGSTRGSPSRRWPQAFGLEVEAVEEVWHGLRPPFAELFDWAEGRGGPADRPRRARCSGRSCSPIRSRRRRSRSTTMPPNGNGTGSASSSSMPAARPGSTAAPATTFRAVFPTSPRRSGARACSTASCWCAGRPGRRGRARRRRGELQRAPAEARPQECQPEDARRYPGVRPPLRHIVRRRRGSARAALDRAARAARSGSPTARSASVSTCRS